MRRRYGLRVAVAVAVGVVVAIAAIGVFLAVHGGHGSDVSPYVPGIPGAPAPAPDGPHATDTSMAIPQTAPSGVTWTNLNGVYVPLGGTKFGPVSLAAPASIYAHTPTGALFAVLNIGARHAVGLEGQHRSADNRPR